MDIKKKAREFAIEAHRGQVRKAEKEKPMVVHPINVGQILEGYGFDDNIVAAGYLHDVVEDTDYTLKDIKKEFGEDIMSLVDGATEPDKTLSWEERKQHTINIVKTLDTRHKAIVCADKISNLEDIIIFFEKKGKYDYSSFKRGYDSQRWYYQNVCKSILNGEDPNNPMLKRLQNLVNYLYKNEKDNLFKKDIFRIEREQYNKLKLINFKNEEIKKLNSVLDKKYPYIIEFTNSSEIKKIELIEDINYLLKKAKLNVQIFERQQLYKNFNSDADIIILKGSICNTNKFTDGNKINIDLSNVVSKGKRDIFVEVANMILDNMREYYIVQLNEQYGKNRIPDNVR